MCESISFCLSLFSEDTFMLDIPTSITIPDDTYTYENIPYFIYFCVGGPPSQMSVSTPRRTKYLNFLL